MGTAELRGKVSLNSTGFVRGLKRLRGSVARLSATIGAPFTRAVGKMITFGKVAATIGVIGVIAATRAASNYGDELGKMAKRTGVSTQELARLGLAAELSGADIKGLEKGMKRLAGTIFDAELGLATAKDALTALGLSFEELKGKTPDKQLNIVLEALAGVEDASLRLALADDVLGKAGIALLPILSAGTDGLRKMKAMADKLGLVLTDKQIENAEAFKDQITLLRGAILGLSLKGVGFNDFNAALSKATKLIVDFGNSARFRNIISAFKMLVLNAVETVNRIIKAWQSLSTQSRKAFVNMGKLFVGLFLAFKLGLAQPLILLLGLFIGKLIAGLGTILFNFTAFATGVAAFAAGIVKVLAGLAAGIIGFFIGLGAVSLGEALERKFSFSSLFGILINQSKIGFDTIIEIWKNRIKNIRTLAGLFNKAITGDLSGAEFDRAIIGMFDGSVDIAKKAMDKLAQVTSDGIAEMKQSAEDADFVELFKESFAGNVDPVKRDFEKALNKVIGGLAGLKKKIIAPFQEFKDALANVDATLPDFVDPFKGVTDGANNAVKAIQDLKKEAAPLRGFLVRQEQAQQNRGIQRIGGGARVGLGAAAGERQRAGLAVRADKAAADLRGKFLQLIENMRADLKIGLKERGRGSREKFLELTRSVDPDFKPSPSFNLDSIVSAAAQTGKIMTLAQTRNMTLDKILQKIGEQEIPIVDSLADQTIWQT